MAMLYEPIPEEKITVKLKMKIEDLFGFREMHIQNRIGIYVEHSPNGNEKVTDYYIIGFSVVAVELVPESEHFKVKPVKLVEEKVNL